jgi:hypothetical protein
MFADAENLQHALIAEYLDVEGGIKDHQNLVCLAVDEAHLIKKCHYDDSAKP